MQREVLAVQKRVLGDEHPDTLDTAGNLAVSCCEQGKHAEAEAHAARGACGAEAGAGRRAPRHARHSRATWHFRAASKGKHAEAEALQREVLAVQKRVLGDEHPRHAPHSRQPGSFVQRAGQARGGRGTAVRRQIHVKCTLSVQ